MSSVMKKATVLVLTVAMMLTAFAGCSGNATPSPAAAGTASPQAATATSQAPATVAPVEVKTLKVWQADTWEWDKPGKQKDWDSYENCKAITDLTGIKLEYEIPTGTQDELLGPMIASDSLPDTMIITNYTENAFINQMIDAGMLWSYDDLLGQYAPEALTKFKASSAYMYHTYTDSKCYKFVGFEANADKMAEFNLYGIPPTDGGSVWWVRKDILAAFGKEDITSLDEYADYLRFVKKNYPDVQPFMLKGNSWYPLLMTTFGVPYDGASGSMRCNIASDGKLEVVAKNQSWIDYCKWFNMLYREGIITASQFTEQDQQANERKYAGKVGSFICSYYDTHDNVNQPLIDGGKADLVYVDIGPIQKDGVEFKLPALRDTGCLAWVVSKKVKEPEVAAKWFGAIMYDNKVNLLATGGFEGTDYTVNSDGTVKVSSDFTTGINKNIEDFCTSTGFISKFLPWISGPNWVSFVENPMAGKDANPTAYEVSVKRQGQQYIKDMWADGFVDLPNAIDPTSEAGIAQTKCNDDISNLFLKLAVANSDEEFNTIYKQGLADLEKDGAAAYEKALNEQYQKQLALLGK